MSIKEKFLNIFGQIRIYSLLDFILLLIAINASKYELTGAILLHISFLFFLEETHKHSYRKRLPKYFWMIPLIVGLIFLHNFAIFLFIIFSFLYANKNKYFLGSISPLLRGIQSYFIVASILGFFSPVAYLAFNLFAIRNFAGDLRDIEKDKKEGLKTLPIIFGLKRNIKHIHFICLLITTLVWWYLARISVLWLFSVYLIQLLTYNLTPR